MTRVRTGWRLAMDSFRLLKADSSLLVFPLISTALITIALALTMTPGLVISEAADRDWIVLPFMLAAGYATVFLAVYFNVALAAAVRLSMGGRDTTAADGLAVARSRRGLIAKWAVIQFVLGVLTRVAQRVIGDAGGALAAVLLGLTGLVWTIASFFAVPLLALEGLGPRDALKRSMGLVRERWGEGLVGHSVINTAVLVVAALPLIFLLNFAVALIDINKVAGGIAGVIFIVALVATCVFGSALSLIFRVALYRYATEGQVAAGFAEQDMTGAFAARPSPAA